ncbi:hypothetical protein GCM10011391_27270 [Pullulanibacillus camelliae]|uniref:DUF2624 domain-containing protein n=1 Tax=Pullulanibacillus camelliae TaxID=1707096 RepID=A0A8J2YJV2_9BACL|nr:DUF2624 family protein [Pullulanibacillus camelliae]GGE47011.1 hypothetical protein GCM10011391_27270 [Pullulanibacillus camelliae]
MNNIMKQFINLKMNTLTPQELLRLGNKYQLHLSKQQAEKIVGLIKEQKINVFNKSERSQLLQKIALVTNQQIAQQMEYIFSTFIGGNAH